MKLFLSCEHGGNHVPNEYQHLFINVNNILKTHRGYDKGALELYNALNKCGVHFSIFSETTRLLVDINRSLHRRTLFSEYSKHLSADVKKEVLNHYYYPFRNSFFEEALRVVDGGEDIFHVSVHAFTPVLNGIERRADIGLLYNPSHGIERKLAIIWKKELQKVFPNFVIRYNYPYLGKTDGHVAPLRRALGKNYAGIEFELNSKHSGNIKVIGGIVLTYKKIIEDGLFLGTPKKIQ